MRKQQCKRKVGLSETPDVCQPPDAPESSQLPADISRDRKVVDLDSAHNQSGYTEVGDDVRRHVDKNESSLEPTTTTITPPTCFEVSTNIQIFVTCTAKNLHFINL